MTRRVDDLMRREVLTISAGASLAALEREFMAKRVSGFPVLEDGRLVGIVSRSDVVRQLTVEDSLAAYTSDFYRGALNVNGEPEDLDDVAERAGRHLGSLRVRDVMSSKVISVRPDDDLATAARLMVERRIHRLPVIDDAGALVGILSTLDLVALLADSSASA